MSSPTSRHGALAWMVTNPVAAKLLMIAFIAAGLFVLPRLKQEVFPEFAIDVITITVAYPGASPEEVERGVTKSVEEAVRGRDNIKLVTSTSAEGAANVTLELELGADKDRVLNDIKVAVDRITSFPEDIERPVVALVEIRNHVVSMVLYGDVSEKALRDLADRARDELTRDPRVSQVELSGIRPVEISVEVPRHQLAQHGITLDQIAAAVRAANVELPAGAVRTEKGEVLVRTTERRDVGRDFEDIVVASNPNGAVLRLGDIAHIDDGFREIDQRAYFNGKPAAMVQVYRAGDQTPMDVSEAVRAWIDEHRQRLPPGVEVAVWNDRSEMFQRRIDLLVDNAIQGLILVVLCLGLFLEPRLAFWVSMGIPTSMLGALIFMPAWDVSINMISLVGFIITTGVVVDDAIVIGDAIHKRKSEGLEPLEASIRGVRDVSVPVVFSVLTTCVAFCPLLFVPGTTGKFFRNIPTVVITVLLISLMESVFVLPAHIAHASALWHGLSRKVLSRLGVDALWSFLVEKQTAFSTRFERMVERHYGPLLRRIVEVRYLTLSAALAVLIAAFGYVASGRMAFTFMPKIEGDVVFAQLRMPFGTPAATTDAHLQRMVAAAQDVLRESGGIEASSRGIFAQVGAATGGGMSPARGGGESGSHVAEVAVFMTPVGARRLSASELGDRWRRQVGEIAGAETVKFTSSTGSSTEPPIAIQLSHQDPAVLETAAAELAASLGTFDGVKDVDDGVVMGKEQVDLALRPEARAQGVTEVELARQVRSSFFGVEAARQQRGRDELRVYVRLPDDERASLFDLDELMVRTPGGGEIPLREAADARWRHAYTSIQREDGRRAVTVDADVEQGKANANQVMGDVQRDVLPPLAAKYPGLDHRPAGQQRRQAESLGSLADGFKLALLAMFVLIAIGLRNLAQPLIILLDIPFGMVGALIGHRLLGYDLSMLSMMGFVAMSGVVVNDSIVLVDAINERRAEGAGSVDAVVTAAVWRFRAITLTSLTTFVGLAPLILERDLQARFLVPLAISLGFGVTFSTVSTLLIVPCIHVAYDDLAERVHRLLGVGPTGPMPSDTAGPAETADAPGTRT